MWVKLASRDDDASEQKRHCEDEILDRAAAIFSSIVWLISSSEASPSMIKPTPAGDDFDAGTALAAGLGCEGSSTWISAVSPSIA